MKKKRHKKSWKKRKAAWEEWQLKQQLKQQTTIVTKTILLPRGAVVADRSILAANNNTYGPLPPYYKNITFTCRDCGNKEIWTAEQQKWWYEVVKANINSKAVRCHTCRAKIRAEKMQQKKHMKEMAKRKPHPNEAFFRKRVTKVLL